MEWLDPPPIQRDCGLCLTPVETVTRTCLPIYPNCVKTLQVSGFSFEDDVNKRMCVHHLRSYVLICQNNHNTLDLCTSQLVHVLTEEVNAVICNIQQCLQIKRGIGAPQVICHHTRTLPVNLQQWRARAVTSSHDSNGAISYPFFCAEYKVSAE